MRSFRMVNIFYDLNENFHCSTKIWNYIDFSMYDPKIDLTIKDYLYGTI